MKPDDFEQYKQGLVNQLLQRPQTLDEEAERYRKDFNLNNFAFDSREKMIAQVKQLTANELADFFQQAVIKPQGLALLSQVKGQGRPEDSQYRRDGRLIQPLPLYRLRCRRRYWHHDTHDSPAA